MSILFVYILLLSVVASFVQRTVGFGFGIFIMTMLPFLMPSYGEATTLSGLLAMTTSAYVSWRMRRQVHWGKLLPILVTMMIVSSLCIFWLKQMDDRLLRQILGVVLILTSIYFAFFSSRIQIPTTLPYQLGTGVLSGAMGGFFSMQGPPAVLYLISSSRDKNEYMAQVQTYFLCGNLVMTAVRGVNGFLTPTVGIDYIYGLGGVIIGNLIGGYVFNRIPNRLFRYIVYAYIALAGVITFIAAE